MHAGKRPGLVVLLGIVTCGGAADEHTGHLVPPAAATPGTFVHPEVEACPSGPIAHRPPSTARPGTASG